MYEELVTRLRKRAVNLKEKFSRNAGLLSELMQAADAIEEQQQIVDHFKGCADDWYQEACDYKAQIPRWISVKERLPESGVHVLASCRIKYVGGGGHSYVCDAFYSERFKEQRSTEYDEIELDYDEETDEYYLPEGWWEVIKNWDDYAFVAIEDTVTHWMPLPEPPGGKDTNVTAKA